MKVLTVKQPWADLIVSGVKDIENRSQRTHFRGTILIHAGKSISFSLLTEGLNKEQLELVKKDKWLFSDTVKSLSFKKSAIIGQVDIIDCVINHQSVWAEKMVTYTCKETGIEIIQKGQKYVWNWVLGNPIRYENAIENVNGKLSFWNYEKDTNRY